MARLNAARTQNQATPRRWKTSGYRAHRRSRLRDTLGFIALGLMSALAFWQFKPIPSIALTLATPSSSSITGEFSLCGRGLRANCVVDGDTFYLGREKIRIADINTPEVSSPQCEAEARLGARATDRLRELLNAGPIEVRGINRSHDVYGRRLLIVHRDGRSLGETLVAEGLAHRWEGYRRNWCG